MKLYYLAISLMSIAYVITTSLVGTSSANGCGIGGGIRNLSGRLTLNNSMFSAATEAWDRREELQAVGSRTVNIPTLGVATTDFSLSAEDAAALHTSGVDRTHAFLTSPSQRAYMNLFGQSLHVGAEGAHGQPSSSTGPPA
jgi:hypothetical protein